MENFSSILVNKLLGYLENRLSINDAIRLANNDEYLSLDQVYSNYLKGVEEGYASKLRFDNNYHSTFNGEKLKFTKQEIDEVFKIIREYLLDTSISQIPDMCGNEIDFIISVLNNAYLYFNNLDYESMERVKKYVVAFNCLKVYLSFYNDIEGTIVKDGEYFYVEDHKDNRFIQVNHSKEKVRDYTEVALGSNVYVVHVRNKETGLHDILFKVSLTNNPTFLELKDEYYRDTVETLEHFLEENECSFLMKDIFDVEELNTTFKDLIGKYIFMMDDDMKRINELAFLAANWWVVALETVNFCSSIDLHEGLVNHYLTLDFISKYLHGRERFSEVLKNEIKRELLLNDFVRISSQDLNSGVFKVAFNKSNFELQPMYLNLERLNGKITYDGDNGETIELIPKVMKGFEDMFSMHDFLTSPLLKEMDICDGDIYVTNKDNDKVLLFSSRTCHKNQLTEDKFSNKI